MNEDKVMQIIINLKKFNSDLMDLNIKYAEEIERLKDENEKLTKEWLKSQEKRRKAIEYIKNNCYIETTNEYMKYGDDLSPEHLVDILQGSDKE